MVRANIVPLMHNVQHKFQELIAQSETFKLLEFVLCLIRLVNRVQAMHFVGISTQVHIATTITNTEK